MTDLPSAKLADLDAMPPADEGARLLDELRVAVSRYVVLPSAHALDAVVLWIVATHAVDNLHTAPRLAIRSPEKRCGKTRLLDVIVALCRRALPTANVSSAVLYRVMGSDRKPTLVIDEADTVWGTKKQAEQNEDLRGLVNAGFERGRPTLRYNAAIREVEELETFGFVALAGIGTLPDTITDRAVNVTMRRRRAGEQVAPFRSRRDGEPLRLLRDQVADWVLAHADDIEKADPELPVEDRAADVWEGLIAVADIAGGHWPALARGAAVALSEEHTEDDAADSDSLRLLGDIREVFATARISFMASRDLTNALRHLEDAPWAEYDLSTVKLADRLRNYKIVPRRNTAGTARGYRLEDFTDAFSRYLATHPSEPVKSSDSQVSEGATSDGLTGQGVSPSDPSGALTRQSDVLTGSDGWSAQIYDREH